MHIMEGKTGEVLFNGDFATGNLDGWRVGDPDRIYLAQQDGGNVVVLTPTPIPIKGELKQVWDLPSPSGDYLVSFEHRVSDAAGAPIEDVFRVFGAFLFFHPTPGSGDTGKIVFLEAQAMPYWRPRPYRFNIQASQPMKMEITFYNPPGDKSPALNPAPENVTIENVPDSIPPGEGSDVVPAAVPVVFRNISLFKTS